MMSLRSIASDSASRTFGFAIGLFFWSGRKAPQNWKRACIVPGTETTSRPERAGTAHRFRPDRYDPGLAGTRHRDAGAFLRHQQDLQILEMGRAVPMRVIDRLELDPVTRHVAHEFPRAA